MAASQAFAHGQRTAAPDTPRPTRRHPDVMVATVEALLPDVLEWMEGDAPRDSGFVKADLLEALRSGDFDGFDLATRLSRKGWDGVDADLVETLNSAESYAWTAERAAVETWALGQAATLDIPTGTVVDTPWGRGPVVHREPKTLAYGVRCEGQDTNTWTVVPYEKVAIVAEVA